MFGPFDFFIVFFFIPAVIMYFVPTIVAIIRRARNLAGIILINLFLGWTFFGWVGALVWAVGYNSREIRQLRELVEENATFFLEKWYEHFSPR